MWVLTHVTGMEHRLFHSVTHGVPLENTRPCCAVGFEVGLGVGVQGCSGVESGRVVLIDNGRVYQSKAADALVQVKTTKFGTNVGLNMLLNISSRYLGGLFWSRQLWGLPSSDGYYFRIVVIPEAIFQARAVKFGLFGARSTLINLCSRFCDNPKILLLAVTKQLSEWFCLSVRPSVTPFSLYSHHRIIMKFSGVITNAKSDVHAKGQRSRSQRSKPNLAVSGL